eukprot:82263_1
MESVATLRSKSSEKWMILFVTCSIWIASYYCILCMSALEDETVKAMNLSETEFSLLTAISFAIAMLSSLCTPYIIKQINLYNAMLMSSTCLTIGQIIFIVGIYFKNIYISYLGRVFIGIGYGIDNVTISTSINVWFSNSEWLTFALNAVYSTYEIGVLISRYSMTSIYNINNDLIMPYLLGVLFGFISIVSCITMIVIEKSFLKKFNIPSTTCDDLDSDFRKIKGINLMCWLLMILIVIGWSSTDTLYSQYTLPLMTIFNITEVTANILLSVGAIYALTIGQISAWLITKLGFLSYWLILAFFLKTLSLGILLFYDIYSNIFNSEIIMWIITILYGMGVQYFAATSFTCLYTVCPLELTSLITAVSSIGFMSGSAIESYLFGLIADNTIKTHTYRYSILMMVILLTIGLIISIIIHSIDIKTHGPLHKKQIVTNNDNQIELSYAHERDHMIQKQQLTL